MAIIGEEDQNLDFLIYFIFVLLTVNQKVMKGETPVATKSNIAFKGKLNQKLIYN